MIKVTVITINYNNAEGLEKTIQSVVGQSYSNMEYIIIDGGSTDSSIEIINKYINNISYWISEKDAGIYHAMNKGIRKATGDFILFLNSGDYLCNNNVIANLLQLDAEAPDIIYGNLERTFPDGTNDTFKMPPTITVDWMINKTLPHPSTLIKSDLFKKYGLYDESLKIVADWAFFLKVLILGNADYLYKDIDVSVFAMDGLSSKLSNQTTIWEERKKVINSYFSTAFKMYISEKDRLEFYYKKYRIEMINSTLKKIKSHLLFLQRPFSTGG